MKKLLITIFCSLAIFTLGYTTYAETIKNLIDNPSKISPEEKMARFKVEQYKRFIQEIPSWISKEDRESLISQIEPLISSSTLKTVEFRPSVEDLNSKILIMMKIQSLNMYFKLIPDLKNNINRSDFIHQESNMVIPNHKIQNKIKSKISTSMSFSIEKDIVHKIINSTSIEFISDMRWSFMEKNIKGFKRPEVDRVFIKKDFIKNSITPDFMKHIQKEEEIKENIPLDAEISTTTEIITTETIISTSTDIGSTTTEEVAPIITETESITVETIAETIPEIVQEIITNTENQ